MQLGQRFRSKAIRWLFIYLWYIIKENRAVPDNTCCKWTYLSMILWCIEMHLSVIIDASINYIQWTELFTAWTFDVELERHIDNMARPLCCLWCMVPRLLPSGPNRSNSQKAPGALNLEKVGRETLIVFFLSKSILIVMCLPLSPLDAPASNKQPFVSTGSTVTFY